MSIDRLKKHTDFFEKLYKQLEQPSKDFNDWKINKLNYYEVINNNSKSLINLKLPRTISKDELKKIKEIFGKDYSLKEVGLRRSGGIMYEMPHFV